MKKTLIVAVAALAFACNNKPAETGADTTQMKKDSPVAMKPIQSPYSILYSSSFVMDEPKNAETLLALWKAYDNGDLMSTKEMFADTVDAHLANGLDIHASRDSVIAMVQKVRNSYKAAVDEVHAIMAVKATDKNEHWALIWGTERDTHKNGKVDSVDLQETWQFDDNGKAKRFFQFAAVLKPAGKK